MAGKASAKAVAETVSDGGRGVASRTGNVVLVRRRVGPPSHYSCRLLADNDSREGGERKLSEKAQTTDEGCAPLQPQPLFYEGELSVAHGLNLRRVHRCREE